jgi:hypothetical protein
MKGKWALVIAKASGVGGGSGGHPEAEAGPGEPVVRPVGKQAFFLG